MAISAKDVKELRETTGAGMMDCKKALGECGGDKEKAVDYLRAKGLAAVAKKQSRVAAEGLVKTFVTSDQKTGVVVEVNCETDFVAKNDDFKNFVAQLCELVAQNNFASNDDVLNAKVGSETVSEMINNLTLKIGEKISLRRFEKKSIAGSGSVASYVHGGKIAVLVNIETDGDVNANTDFQEFGKDICMHIAASETLFLEAGDMDANYIKREEEVYAAQLKEQGKPENMIANIVKGKISKLASQVCLLQQKFVKDPDMTIAKLIEDMSAKVGAKISIASFSKTTLGEGIEKKVDNLADEVAKMANS